MRSLILVGATVLALATASDALARGLRGCHAPRHWSHGACVSPHHHHGHGFEYGGHRPKGR